MALFGGNTMAVYLETFPPKGSSDMSNVMQPGSQVGPEVVITQRVITQQLAIKADEIIAISHSYGDGAPNHIPSSKALFDGLHKLQQTLDDLDPQRKFFVDTTVITLPLLTPTVTASNGWLLANWQSHEAGATYLEGYTPGDNYIKVPQETIQDLGHYFFDIDVDRIDRGELVLLDKNNFVLGKITTAGKACFEVQVTEVASDSFRLVARSLNPGDTITVSKISFHRVTPRMYDYFTYKLRGLGAGSGVGEDYVDAAIATLGTELIARIAETDESVETVTNLLQFHLANTGNPHRVTAGQIGAAPTVHTHSLSNLGAAAVQHTHLAEECGAAPINHNHQPEEVGAAPTIHTHTPEQCGAAPTSHGHTEYITTLQLTTAIETALNSSVRLSNTLMSPLVIVDAPTGQQPIGFQESGLSLPAVVMYTDGICHADNSAYDFVDGVCSTNVLPLPTNPIEYAFKKLLTGQDYDINVAAFATTTDILTTPVKLQYTFHTAREIGAVVLRKDLTDKIIGVPTKWSLYVDHQLVKTSSVSQETWYIDSPTTRTVLPIPVKGKVVTFVVHEVTRPDDVWGAALDFEFTDVPANRIVIPAGLKVALPDTFGNLTVLELSEALWVTPDPGAIAGLSLYPILIAGDTPSVILTPIPPEYDTVSRGVLALQDTYIANPHPYWGTLTATSTAPACTVDDLYRSNNVNWLSAPGVAEATITHTFARKFTMTGYELAFTKDLIDLGAVPTNWTLSLMQQGGNIVTIPGANVEDYLPDISEDSYDQSWFSCQFPEPVESVVQITLTVHNADGNQVGISKFMPRLTSFFYNITEGRTFFESKPMVCIPLGVVEYTQSQYGWVGYRPKSRLLGKHGHLPVCGMKTLAANSTVTIDNPFLTRHIDLTMCGIRTNNLIAPNARIESITEQTITIYVETEGKYSVKIAGTW